MRRQWIAVVIVFTFAVASVLLLWSWLDGTGGVRSSGAGGLAPEMASGPAHEEVNESAEGLAVREEAEGPGGVEDPELAPPLSLIGRVRNAAGEDIEHASIRLNRMAAGGGKLGTGERDRFATTGAVFAFVDLLSGDWRVSVQAGGYVGVEGRVELREGDGDRHLDLVLRRSRLLPVRLQTPEGSSLVASLRDLFGSPFATRNLHVVATRQPLPRPRVPAWSERPMVRAAGSYHDATTFSRGSPSGIAIPSGSDGMLELPGPESVEVALLHGANVLVSVPIGADAEAVVLRCSREDFQSSCTDVDVQLLGEAGEPVPGASLQISGRSSRTDEQGRATISLLPRGPGSLEIHAGEYQQVKRSAWLGLDGVPDLSPFELRRRVQVRGRVVDGNGEPVAAGIRVFSLDHWHPPSLLYALPGHGTEEDGSFETKLGRGSFLLLPAARAWGSELLRSGLEPTRVDTTGGPLTDIVLRALPGTPVQIIPRFDLPHALLATVLDADGTPVWSRELLHDRDEGIDLVPGRYRLQLDDLVGTRFVEEFAVGTEVLRLVIGPSGLLAPEEGGEGLAELASLDGVRELAAETRDVEKGVVLTGVAVVGDPSVPIRLSAEVVDVEGEATRARVDGLRFTFPRLMPGAYRLFVSASGFAEARSSIRVDPSPAVQSIQVELRPLQQLRVALQAVDGRPLFEALPPELGFQLRGRVFVTEHPPGTSMSASGRILAQRAVRQENSLELSVEQSPPFHVSLADADRLISTRPVDSLEEEAVLLVAAGDLEEEPATLSFRILDATDGSPVDGAPRIEGRRASTSAPELQTDEEGRTWMDLRPDEYTLTFFRPESEYLHISFTLAPGQHLELGDILLRPAVRTVLQVRDPDGAAIGVAVQLFELDAPADRPPTSPGFQSTADGVLELFPVAEGKYELRVVDAAWPRQSFSVEVRAGEEQGPELHLRAGTELSCLVKVDSDEWLRLRALDGQGREVARTSTRAHRRAGLRLLPGSYTLQVVLRDEVLATRELTLGEQPLRVTLGGG